MASRKPPIGRLAFPGFNREIRVNVLPREELVRVGHTSTDRSPESGKRQPGLSTVSMRKRYGKFYADWIDEAGHRRMKACATKKAALRLTEKMRREVASKKAHASGPSTISAPRSPRPSRKPRAKSAPRPRSSPPSAARSQRTS